MLWAITTVFAPFPTAHLRKNFLAFRAQLNVPLLAVEIQCGQGAPLLEDDDADRVVRVEGDCLWQKERGLNIAVDQLPSKCRYVLAIDCDVAFSSSSSEGLCYLVPQLLEDWVALQPFSVVDYLALDGGLIHSWPSVSSTKGTMFTQGDQVAHGNAWAFRRDFIERHRFYDRFVVGGGDLAMSAALWGRQKTVPERHRMSPTRAHHYLRWANKVAAEAEGRVGHLAFSLEHLWHGPESARQYHKRKTLLDGFVPDDVVAQEGEGLRWRPSVDVRLRDRVAAYFRLRSATA